MLNIFYRTSFEKAQSKNEFQQYLIWETGFWFLVWVLAEAYLFKGLFREFYQFFNNGAWFFYDIYFYPLAWPFDILASLFHPLEVLGSGDFRAWLARAAFIWAVTGLPVLIYKIYKYNERAQDR